MGRRVLTAALVIAMAAVLCMTAAAEGEEHRLNIAFGLFSVELPEGVTAGPNTGNELSDFRFETDGMLKLIYANCAPMDEYESTARRKLNSYISFVFSIAGGKYSETGWKTASACAGRSCAEPPLTPCGSRRLTISSATICACMAAQKRRMTRQCSP